jgi:DGQHR domain-containing protein
MNYPIIEYTQNGHRFISAVLPFEIIDQHSHVLVYDRDEGGYQREPDSKHFNSIKKYVQDTPDYLFPTSIILGLDEVNYDHIVTHASDSGHYMNFDNAPGTIFRIVDGQHRIRGLREAAVGNATINQLQLNVVILLTPQNTRSLEMEIFNTINSKSKRIRVDLIQLARYEYRILEQSIQPSDLNEHISIQIANLLNEHADSRNIWFNAIKFGIHDEQKVGIIGVNAFRESLRNIVGKYLQTHITYQDLSGTALISYSKDAATFLKVFIYTAWNEIIFEKWPDTFSSKNQELDYDQEIKEFFYNNKYYIQKTLGTKSLNYLLASVVTEHGVSEESLNRFRDIINKSQLLTSDWEVGKTFSGYSSESAFNKVTKIIRNEMPALRGY